MIGLEWVGGFEQGPAGQAGVRTRATADTRA